MSFANSASKAIESIIHDYIQQLSTKYSLNPEELLAIWVKVSDSFWSFAVLATAAFTVVQVLQS